MDKRDKVAVRTPLQLEQKYNLGQLSANSVENSKIMSQLSQINQMVSQFVSATNGKLSELEQSVADAYDYIDSIIIELAEGIEMDNTEEESGEANGDTD